MPYTRRGSMFQFLIAQGTNAFTGSSSLGVQPSSLDLRPTMTNSSRMPAFWRALTAPSISCFSFPPRPWKPRMSPALTVGSRLDGTLAA